MMMKIVLVLVVVVVAEAIKFQERLLIDVDLTRSSPEHPIHNRHKIRAVGPMIAIDVVAALFVSAVVVGYFREETW